MQYILLASFCIYLLACCLHSFKSKQNGELLYLGVTNLFFGVFSLFTDAFSFIAWCANIPYFIVLFFAYFYPQYHSIWLLFLSVLSIILGSSIFKINTLLYNEGGTTIKVRPYIGAFLWWLSMWLICLFETIIFLQKQP